MEYLDTLKKYMSGKKYANKNVRSADGTIGYVTATGVSKVYGSMEDYQATAGKNNCPADFIKLTPNWKDLGFPVGSTMKSGQSCGNENTYVQPSPPETKFDWKFYLQQNPDLGQAGLTTEQQANDHWNTYGKQEGRLPNASILSSMATLGKVGYIDVDTMFHAVPSTPGDYKAFTSRSNVSGTKMEDCSKPIPPLTYGTPIVFTQNNQKGSLQTSSLVFGTNSTPLFFRPPPGDDRQGQSIKYGDIVCITSSSSSRTNDCGWWGCKVGLVDSSNKMNFGPGGEKTATFHIFPPPEHFKLMNSVIKYGFPFILVSISTSNAAKLSKGASVNCKSGTAPPNMPGGVYRYSGNNTLQYYPTPEIASSWNSNWGSTVDIDCRTYALGDTATKLNAASLNNGATVGCMPGKELPNGVQGGIYRYVEDNILRWYPNPSIASAWNPRWARRIKWTDCTSYKAGQPMSRTMESTPVEENIPKYAYVSNGIMVFGSLPEARGSYVFSIQYDQDQSCDVNQLKKMCTDDCVGFVHSPTNNTWQKIKKSTNYKISPTMQDFYIKEATVNVNDSSCNTGKAEFIDPTLFSNYLQGDDLKVGGVNQCNVIAPPPSYKGKPLNTKDMKNYKSSMVELQKKQQEKSSYMKTRTKEYKEVTQGIKNTPTMDTLEQQYLDMTVFDSQNKTNLILWAILSTTIIAFVLIRK